MKDEKTSPAKVLARVSQGIIAGPIAVAAKKIVIPNKPGTNVPICMFLPTEKARNEKMGIVLL
jgi:hypothetical protein